MAFSRNEIKCKQRRQEGFYNEVKKGLYLPTYQSIQLWEAIDGDTTELFTCCQCNSLDIVSNFKQIILTFLFNVFLYVFSICLSVTRIVHTAEWELCRGWWQYVSLWLFSRFLEMVRYIGNVSLYNPHKLSLSVTMLTI